MYMHLYMIIHDVFGIKCLIFRKVHACHLNKIIKGCVNYFNIHHIGLSAQSLHQQQSIKLVTVKYLLAAYRQTFECHFL